VAVSAAPSFRFVLRRIVSALLLILFAASASLLLSRAAPGDHLSTFDLAPEFVAAERARLGLDRPVWEQYLRWLAGAVRFDLGESTAYPGQRIPDLVGDRAGNSALIGVCALIVATIVGIPLGVVSGSSRRPPVVRLVRGVTLLLLSIPPVVLSFLLLFVASRTGWFPVGGLPADGSVVETARHLVLPVLALGLPAAAALERLQARSMAEALRAPSMIAALARGLSRRRVVWRHALRLSAGPVLGVYGVIIGGLISGSFVVEFVMTWPGLARLMYDALLHRDANLVAACAAAGAAFLSAGVLAADLLLAACDPRLEERS
jgi:peptide/nickel transport system permease protein